MKGKARLKEIKVDEIFTAEVKKHGNGARIPFLKKYIGKKVFIVIEKEK